MAEFNSLTSSSATVTLVDFHASEPALLWPLLPADLLLVLAWCGPCKAIAPVVQRVRLGSTDAEMTKLTFCTLTARYPVRWSRAGPQ